MDEIYKAHEALDALVLKMVRNGSGTYAQWKEYEKLKGKLVDAATQLQWRLSNE